MGAETVWKDRRARTLAGTTLRHNHLAETGLEDRWARTLMGTHSSAQPFSTTAMYQ